MNTQHTTDLISIDTARTLDGLFRERVRRSPDKTAYVYFDKNTGKWLEHSWSSMEKMVRNWRAGLAVESLKSGDRVGIMMRNCCEWVLFEQAALSLGLVVVPLYPNDRPDSAAYIINDAEVKLLLIENKQQWLEIGETISHCGSLSRVVVDDEVDPTENSLLISVANWLPRHTIHYAHQNQPDDLATIVYTSGTTGNPKGVMLSHRNILWDAWSGMQHISVYAEDSFLSFLPLSHSFERTIGYYIPMMAGASVAYARSVAELGEDLLSRRPTVLVSVPRIFERVCDKIRTKLESGSPVARKLFSLTVDSGWHLFQWRQHQASWHPLILLWPLLRLLVARKIQSKLGGRLRFSVCGGAPLPFNIARTFIGLGVQIEQGYGLTETSPVLSVNKIRDNDPKSVGIPLEDVEAKLAANGELLVRSPGVMLGYWNNEEATHEMIDEQGWLHTGDKAEINNNHIYITGRLKDVLVLANGEKVPPIDMEAALVDDTLIEQALVIGEAKPYLSALLVLNRDQWEQLAARFNIDANSEQSLHNEAIHQVLLKRISEKLHNFPGYAQIRRIELTLDDWNIENGLMTPTLKLRRQRIIQQHSNDIDHLYEGHNINEVKQCATQA